MDVDSVLVSVQERDKWRRRLALLEGSLSEVKQRRARQEARLRRIKRELAKLTDYSDAVLSRHAAYDDSRSVHAARDARIPAR